MSRHIIVPAGPPPPGVLSNFVDPVSRAPNLIACNIVLLVVSTIIVGLRIICRTVLTDWRLGWDDWTMVLALIGTTIFGSFVIVTTHYGLGKHIWDVPLATYSPGYLWWIMATFASCPASYYFVKISILLFYLRVFQLQSRLRYIIYALIVYCTIYYWVAFSTVIGLCNVKDREWDITVTMNCFAYGKLTFVIGGMDLLADAMILAFPVPMVLKLRISWSQRIYLLFVFLFGLTASVACAIRVAFAAKARGTTDATMAQYHVVTLFCIEHYLALIAGCMPTLGPLFKRLRPSHWQRQTLSKQPCNQNQNTLKPKGFPRVWPGCGGPHNNRNNSNINDSSTGDNLMQQESIRGPITGVFNKNAVYSYWTPHRGSFQGGDDEEGWREREHPKGGLELS